MKDVKRWLPGALISILLIAAILYFVDLGAMVDAMRTANYGMLAVAFAIGFLWVAVRAMVPRSGAQRLMDQLYDLGARAILLTDIHACRL